MFPLTRHPNDELSKIEVSMKGVFVSVTSVIRRVMLVADS